MVGDADKADFPLLFGLLHGLVQAGAVPGLGAEGRVVELVDVHIVGPQQPQAGLQVLPEALHRGGRRLGGDEDLVPHIVEGQAHLLLAVGVGAGGVEKGDAPLVGLAQQHAGVLRGDPLDGQSPKGVFVGDDPGAPQCHLYHLGSSSLQAPAHPAGACLFLYILYHLNLGSSQGGVSCA